MNFRNRIRFSWLVLKESVRSFQLNNDFQTAATLAYYGFFSLIPLLLLVLILLSHFTLSSEVVFEGIAGITEQVLPKFNDVILKEIHALADQKMWGAFSIVILIWVITPFASSLRSAFRRVFRGEKRMHFIKSKLFNVGAVLALLLLFILLVVGKIFLPVLMNALPAGAGLSGYRLLNLLIGAGAGVVFLAFFYLVFCPVKLNWEQRFTGAAVTTLLLFIIRPAFGLLLKYNPNYGFAFGSLKAIFVLTAWIYYAFLAILFGTEVMANVRRREALLFRGLFLAPPSGRGALSGLLERFVRTYQQSEVIFEDGAPGDEMFYILEGEVVVTKHGKTVKVLKRGDFFGEMSMLIDEPRTAGVSAGADVRLVAISRKNFQTILRENPEIVTSILKTMARRLKETTEWKHGKI